MADRRSGIIRSIRRSWSPYRTVNDIYRNKQNASLTTQVLDTGFGIDLIRVEQNCSGGICVPPVKTPIEVLGKYYFRLGDAGTVEGRAAYEGLYSGGSVPSLDDYESHRFYRLFRDFTSLLPTGELDWDGTSLYVHGWATSSELHPMSYRYHETMVLTLSDNRAFALEFDEYQGADNRQTLIAQHDRNGGYFSADGTLDTAEPWVNADEQYFTVLNATGSWTGATEAVVLPSDRPFPPDDEFVVYIWRGFGGQRPSNDIVNLG